MRFRFTICAATGGCCGLPAQLGGRMRFRFIICAATLALVAGACGSDEATTVVEPTGTEAAEEAARDAPADAADAAAQDESPISSAAAPEPSPTTEYGASEAGVQTAAEGTTDDSAAPVPALASPGDVPDLQMINMHTDEAINLQAVVDGQTPLLFWFWAPH